MPLYGRLDWFNTASRLHLLRSSVQPFRVADFHLSRQQATAPPRRVVRISPFQFRCRRVDMRFPFFSPQVPAIVWPQRSIRTSVSPRYAMPSRSGLTLTRTNLYRSAPRIKYVLYRPNADRPYLNLNLFPLCLFVRHSIPLSVRHCPFCRANKPHPISPLSLAKGPHTLPTKPSTICTTGTARKGTSSSFSLLSLGPHRDLGRAVLPKVVLSIPILTSPSDGRSN